ncbi:hypothetical protein SASPL_135871 [Salvia splendens]|uniref:CDP-diacylglycerol--inositol 3-phosphatidyltransferase n=1 Tax=Salvia splendens TaxID=180675 RepID=A0A8X8WYR9_SALSN|nr:hypothetical protein SASPL_135871 [Salvia splendens]
MAEKSRPSTLSVYLYVPNIIGYVRILMNCYAFAICFKDKYLFSLLYFVSFVCDALDGWFARKLNQVSTFGAVLDMVTDRISTACLLVVLSQVYRPGLTFLSLLALDIASHWLQMYSTFLVGKSSHKDVKDSSNWLFKLYYRNRKFMGYCCVSCEVLYIILFLLANNPTENLIQVLLNVSTRNWLYKTLLPLSLVGWAIKQLINIIQVVQKTMVFLILSNDISTNVCLKCYAMCILKLGFLCATSCVFMDGDTGIQDSNMRFESEADDVLVNEFKGDNASHCSHSWGSCLTYTYSCLHSSMLLPFVEM